MKKEILMELSKITKDSSYLSMKESQATAMDLACERELLQSSNSFLESLVNSLRAYRHYSEQTDPKELALKMIDISELSNYVLNSENDEKLDLSGFVKGEFYLLSDCRFSFEDFKTVGGAVFATRARADVRSLASTAILSSIMTAFNVLSTREDLSDAKREAYTRLEPLSVFVREIANFNSKIESKFSLTIEKLVRVLDEFSRNKKTPSLVVNKDLGVTYLQFKD